MLIPAPQQHRFVLADDLEYRAKLRWAEAVAMRHANGSPARHSSMAGRISLSSLVHRSVRQRERSRQHRHFRGNDGKIIHETIGNR